MPNSLPRQEAGKSLDAQLEAGPFSSHCSVTILELPPNLSRKMLREPGKEHIWDDFVRISQHRRRVCRNEPDAVHALQGTTFSACVLRLTRVVRREEHASQAMNIREFVEFSDRDGEQIVRLIDMPPSDLSVIACLARYGFLGGGEIRCKADRCDSQIFQRIGSAECSTETGCKQSSGI